MPETSLDEGQAAAVPVPPLPVPSHRAECPGLAVPLPRSMTETPAPAGPASAPPPPAPDRGPETAAPEPPHTLTGKETGCLFALSQPPLMIFLTVVGLLLLMGAVHDLYLG
nr:hypothetical protein [Streptomyces sp. SPB074]